MIVVSDTSPLLYLCLIDQLALLPKLYEQVLIPEAVRDEILAPGAPKKFQSWAETMPNWLIIKSVPLVATHESIAKLDSGERAAICLAKSLKNTLLLIDEKLGRQAAKIEGLEIIGVLGILDAAAEKGLISFPAAIAQLQKTNFRASPQLIQALLDNHDK